MADQFDKGLSKYPNVLVPSTHLPDSICIPSRFVYQSSLVDTVIQPHSDALTSTDTSMSIDDLVSYYCNAINYLTSYFLDRCTTIDSIGKILSLSSTVFYNAPTNLNSNMSAASSNQPLLVNSSFDMVTLGNCFDARRIQPIPIIETSLLKTLQTTSSFYMKPKTGYCALYKNENIILVMDSEPKTNKLALAGM